jgi:hypothetical protein
MGEHSGKAPELLTGDGDEIKILNRFLRVPSCNNLSSAAFLLPFSVPVSQRVFSASFSDSWL